ncbi:MAG TPA: HAMP domain-containing sensor histidine kinase [Candidatus Limnocylindria bacterium]|nr:HAMP domain-containing sensor histidine kinase [Candidatus Limnocylindria bacterium]
MRSVGGRLFLSYLAVVGVGLLAASIIISGLLVRYENEALHVRLAELSAPLLTAMTTGLRNGQTAREVIDTLKDHAAAADARLLVLASNRRVLVDSENSLVGQTLERTTSGSFGSFDDRGDQWLFVQSVFRPAASGLNPAIIVVARPRAAFADALRILFPALIVAGIVAAGFALVVAGLLSRTITRPLRELAAVARRFAAGDYRARVPIAGPSEVADMGGAFNEMAGEIERARGAEQAFLADISHELRTPLTSIQGFAQAIAEGEATGAAITPAANIIQRESRRLMRMVEGLLQVARLQSGAQELARERVDLNAMLATARAALEPQAHEAGVRFSLAEAADVPPVRGDPDRLAQLFLNLLDNAVKHSPRGGVVTIEAARDGGHAVVRVRDEGSGLPQGANARLFRRFFRGENAERDGTGLGLAIAQAIAEAHGGGVSGRNVEGGTGAEFTVRIPGAER